MPTDESTKQVRPRRALAGTAAPRAGRIGKTVVGALATAALVGGMSWAAPPAHADAVGANMPQLKHGDRSIKVKRLQRELSAYGKDMPDTGYFGDITRSRVNALKANEGLRTNGVAGFGVWHTLFTDGNKVQPVKRGSGGSGGGGSSSSGSSNGKQALAYAKKQIGDGYAYGADGPDAFDCSGLTLAAYRSAGINLPRTSQQQYNSGTRVSKSNLKLGDLVFFYSGISHVGIYAGHGKIIHAPNSNSTVEYTKMSYMPYAGAVRPG